jgi:hypothetical protein
MIQSLDDTLYRLFSSGLTTLGSPVSSAQIRFQPPDPLWRTHVTNVHPRAALNVYLVDVRENRRLRSNERVRIPDPQGAGLLWEEPSPARVDCHYLITAWSNATEDVSDPDNAVHGRTSEEHAILHEVASLLDAHQPLVPAEVFAGAFPIGFAPDLAVATLPSAVLPVEGFPKYAEFWGTMGDTHPWKPAVYLVVTVPLATTAHVGGPPVTTISSEFRPGETRDGAEVVLDLGGHVLDPSDAPVAGAWVRLETTTGRLLQTATTGEAGRFVFTRIPAQSYVLRAGAGGVGAADRPIDVPSPSGEYDLHLI